MNPADLTIGAVADQMMKVMNEFQWRDDAHYLYEGVDRWRVTDLEFTYIIQCEATGLVKIGRSKNVVERLRALQYVSPTPLSPLAFLRGGLAEHKLHFAFSGHREHGEWFRLSDDALLDLIVCAAPEQAPYVVISQAFREKHSAAIVAAWKAGTVRLRHHIDMGKERRYA